MLPDSVRISKQLDHSIAITDMLNPWKDLLNVLPIDNILPVDIINHDVFDGCGCGCGCANYAERLSLHGDFWIAVVL